jgi:sulfide:quinone oxidoreductase
MSLRLTGPSLGPVASRKLSCPLEDMGVSLVTEFNTSEVDGHNGRLIFYDVRKVPFDLAVLVPLHGGQASADCSPGLGDALGFVPTDQHTLQAKASPTSS